MAAPRDHKAVSTIVHQAGLYLSVSGCPEALCVCLFATEGKGEARLNICVVSEPIVCAGIEPMRTSSLNRLLSLLPSPRKKAATQTNLAASRQRRKSILGPAGFDPPSPRVARTFRWRHEGIQNSARHLQLLSPPYVLVCMLICMQISGNEADLCAGCLHLLQCPQNSHVCLLELAAFDSSVNCVQHHVGQDQSSARGL